MFKIRLAEASNALKRIEKQVIAIDKKVSAEVNALAATVLQRVLRSPDTSVTDIGFGMDTAALRLPLSPTEDQRKTALSHALVDISGLKVCAAEALTIC
jgi:hypothetical protein